MSWQDFVTISPLVAGFLTAAAILVVDLIRPGKPSVAVATALIGLAITGALTLAVGATEATAFGGSYQVDSLTRFLDVLFVAIIAMTIVFGPDYLVPRGLPVAEFAAILVFAMTGTMLIAASADLLLLFLGLELMVLPGYLLAGFHKTDSYSTEGAIKYFLLGSFSSAIFLFGIAFIWGLTGTLRLDAIAAELAAVVAGTAPLSPGLAMGLAFLTTGVAFKIAAVPFHYWTPDAYQGSPTPITGYLSVGPKVGAFALILRLFVEALGPLSDWWMPVVIVLATITMTLGNLVALTQDNVKRMLAYSSIAHTGYMLVGLAAWAQAKDAVGISETAAGAGISALLFYGVAYAFMNLGAFAVIAALQKRTGVTSSLGTFAGLGRREPMLGVLMTLFLLSLTGIPPTAGFFAKANIILAAVEAGGPLTILAVITVLNAAVAAFYYLRVDHLHVHARLGQRRAGPPPRRAAVGGPGGGDRVHDPAGPLPDGADPGGRHRGARDHAGPGSRGQLDQPQFTGCGTGFASLWGAASCESGSATTWSLGCVPDPLGRLEPELFPLGREGLDERLVVRHMPEDLGDDVQEALIVVGPDLHDHALHLVAVRHLGARQEGQEHPGPGVAVEVDRLALARLAEPWVVVVHRDVAGGVAVGRRDDREIDLERSDPDPAGDPVGRDGRDGRRRSPRRERRKRDQGSRGRVHRGRGAGRWRGQRDRRDRVREGEKADGEERDTERGQDGGHDPRAQPDQEVGHGSGMVAVDPSRRRRPLVLVPFRAI